MNGALRWFLWLWLSAVILGSFLWAPLSQGFAGLDGQSPQSSRIVFYHVPLAVVSFLAFIAAGIWSILYLTKRHERHDRAALAAVEVGLLYCVLATVTGAMWAKVQWGAYWNWDPRQTSIAMAVLFYAGYMTLRGWIEDPEQQARVAAAFAVLGLVVSPYLYWIMPRLAKFSLHPKPASAEMDPSIGLIVLGGIAGFTALFFWMHRIRFRILALERRALESD